MEKTEIRFLDDLEYMIESLKQGKILHENDLKKLCNRSKEVMSKEENVIYLSAPLTVVGDIHGQFYDLLQILQLIGEPPVRNEINKVCKHLIPWRLC